MRVGRAVGGALGVVVLVLTSACAAVRPGPSAAPSGPSPGVTASSGPSGLSATVVRYRRDAQRDVLQVKVTNAGTTPVHVTHVRLDSVTFTAPVEADKDSRIAAGVSADLTVALGEAACGGDGDDDAGPDPGPSPGGAEHRVRLEVDGASVELPVGGEVLEGVAAERCAARAVADQVDLAVSGTWTDAGEVRGEPVLRGTVLATPQPGAGTLGLAVEGATTLFTVATPSTVRLPSGATEPVALDVLLSVTRCDPHAVAEDKKGYLLPVRVSVDGAAPILVEVAVPVPGRAPLQDLLDRACGFA